MLLRSRQQQSPLRITIDDPEDEMTEPEAIATHLKNALNAIDGIMEELERV